MTVEQTYEYFKEMIDGCGAYELCPYAKDDMEMTKIALAALEKQIPKKPTIHGYREGREINTISYTCPICNKHISRESFCYHCGQALDWGDK